MQKQAVPSLDRGAGSRRLRRDQFRRRPALVAAVLVMAAAGVVGGLLGSSGSSPPHTAAPARVTTASLATFHHAMIARLDAQNAHFFWVACVRTGARFEGVPVTRCNVDFGDPHIQAYCSVFRGGRLVTSADDPAIPCRPDDAGYSQTIETYN
jgi:hypothetical protein